MLNLKGKKQKAKDTKGITLVALVITIIILLILAGIAISSLTNTGLFERAKEAKEKTQAAAENQAKILNEYENELNQYVSGTVEETFKGKTVADAIQYANVLNKNDNTELKDAYGNKIVVPAGFKITNDATTVDKGIVIEDATVDSDGKATATSGSQFVWVPVGKIYTDTAKTEVNAKTIELNRYTFDTNGNPTVQNNNIISNIYQELEISNKGNTVAKSITNFKTSVATNGGYYIGRYEARTATARNTKTDDKGLTQITEKGTDQIYNYVTQSQAASQSQNMYNSNKFTSDLINSYAWDTTTLFLQTCGENKYSRKTSINSSLSTIGTNTQTNKDIQCNIYDMASNIIEWSTETSNYYDSPCIGRSGYCGDKAYYTSYRSIFGASISSNVQRF